MSFVTCCLRRARDSNPAWHMRARLCHPTLVCMHVIMHACMYTCIWIYAPWWMPGRHVFVESTREFAWYGDTCAYQLCRYLSIWYLCVSAFPLSHALCISNYSVVYLLHDFHVVWFLTFRMHAPALCQLRCDMHACLSAHLPRNTYVGLSCHDNVIVMMYIQRGWYIVCWQRISTRGSVDIQFGCVQKDFVGSCLSQQLIIAATGTSSQGVCVSVCMYVCMYSMHLYVCMGLHVFLYACICRTCVCTYNEITSCIQSKRLLKQQATNLLQVCMDPTMLQPCNDHAVFQPCDASRLCVQMLRNTFI